MNCFIILLLKNCSVYKREKIKIGTDGYPGCGHHLREHFQKWKNEQDIGEGTLRGGAFSNLISTVFGAGKEPSEGGIFEDIIDIFKKKKKPGPEEVFGPAKPLELGRIALPDFPLGGAF